MSRQLIAVTSTDRLRPVFGSGIGEGVKRYQTLRDLLEVAQIHAVFAEPVIETGQIRWFSELPGPILPYRELSPDWQEKARAVLRYYADLAVAQLERYHEADALRRLLDECLEIPNDTGLYLVGKRPVLTSWGFLSSDFNPARGLVHKLTRQSVPPRMMLNAKVVRAADHSPIADAVVSLQHGGQTYDLTTNADGNVSFQHIVPIDPLTFQVEATAPTFAAASTTLTAGRTVAELIFDGFYPLITTLVLQPQLDEYDFPLQLVDLETQKPVSGATVRITTAHSDTTQRSLETGRVLFPAVVVRRDEKAVVYVTHPDYADERVELETGEDSPVIALNPAGLRGRRGAFSVNLRWFSTDDLDLFVTDPGNNLLSYQDREVHFKDFTGILDLDANADATTATNDPQENAYWEKAHPGFYTIEVLFYKRRSPKGKPVPFEITVQHGNQQTTFEREAWQEGERVFVDRFVLRPLG
ncbi:carboxypeptidase-like regulatory domain-containing protein [Larkinella rosea]|uniref:Carboxypeptidase regulatory-like domain-containing protein n=1 Tax=Larkinella rosea TaxID=2025312 RepID=A0A3P1BG90_9BACT|nr:carboxypeptidase-like regulatory domain-containing protein [Larkinella rosea]RRB00109.1 carboxypeptidase regulatory-like domain-containing protein [Larkinella rosea]